MLRHQDTKALSASYGSKTLIICLSICLSICLDISMYTLGAYYPVGFTVPWGSKGTRLLRWRSPKVTIRRHIL